jgi:hypothetical protein
VPWSWCSRFRVYLGFDGATGKTVAVKEIPIRPDEAGGGLPMNIINEIAIMRDARHPNLVEYHGAADGARRTAARSCRS